MPCADGDSGHSTEAFQQMLDGHDHSGHDHPAGEDLCSPFCICHCCHTPVVETPALALEAVAPYQQLLSEFYNGRLTEPVPNRLLQPPQMG